MKNIVIALLLAVVAGGAHAWSIKTTGGGVQSGAMQQAACYCAQNMYCVGPKGGKYCIGKNGNKKYL